ncbi:hypothetical protein ACHAXR_010546 [Thalassiosira sp. AJA248-18]
MTRRLAMNSQSMAIIACHATIMTMMAVPSCVEARSWWSLEIPALEGIRNEDPLYAPSSTLLMEDTRFLYGSSFDELAQDDVHVKPSGSANFNNNNNNPSSMQQEKIMDPLTTYSTPTTAPSISEVHQQVVVPPSTSPTIATLRPTNVPSHNPTEKQLTNRPSPPPVEVQMVGPFPDPTKSPETASPETPFPTGNPIIPPTVSPVIPPTFSPSRHYEAANGSCPPNHMLHRVWLYDSVGDGWGSTKLVITEKGASLENAQFVGSLDSQKGVVKFESGANMARTHDKTKRQEASGRRIRRLSRHDVTLGGSINGVNAKKMTGPGGDDGSHSMTRRTPSLASGFVQSRDPRETVGNNAPPSIASTFVQSRDPQSAVAGSNSRISSSEPLSGEGDKSYNNESVYLCLKQNLCYTANVSGGTFLEETSWKITRVEMGTGDDIGLVAEGVGEGSGICDFSLDGSCEKTCDGTAQEIYLPTSSPTPQAPSKSPSSAPTVTPGTPTQSPSILRTKKPVMVSASPQERVYAFGIEEYNRVRNVIVSASPSSKVAVFTDILSPQYNAFEWVYNSDASGLNDSRLVQRWVLASFYYGASGDEWVVKNGWMESGDECQWYGVSCLDGVVSKLELEQNRLVGEIIPEISIWGNDLYVISLGNDYDAPEEERNRFVMPLPSFLGDLPYLTFLNLEGVGLTSTIPEELFSSWPQLESLYLNDNDISGSLPQSIKHLSSIEVLWLGANNLSGSIIPEIGQLSTLKDLSLESNFREDAPGKRGFITTIPPEIGDLANLEILSLANNALSGQVPMQLGDLISLRRLQLSGNFFESQLPPELGRLEMLEELDISFNWLSSTIPPEYGNMISLTSLSLQSNYNDSNGYFTWGIKDKLPTELGAMKNLQHIDLSDNYLTGSLITEIGLLYHLQTMYLQNNYLQGSIPSEYSNCVALKKILLQENNINGESYSMPEEICRLPELELARVDCEVSCSCCLTTC